MKKVILILALTVVLHSTLYIGNSICQWQSDVRLTNASGESWTSWTKSSIVPDGNMLYVVWYDIRDGNNEIYFKRSTDYGATWGTDTRLTNNYAESQNPVILVSGSNLIVVWDDLRDNNNGNEIYCKRSTDAGISWGSDTRLTSGTGNSSGPSIVESENTIHLVWSDERDGNYEIYYKSSTDKGINWSNDSRLTVASGNSLYSNISVSGSTVHLVWSDNRDGNSEIYYKRSSDDGLTWQADTRITVNSGNSTTPLISSWGQFVHMVWSDNFEGNPEIYFNHSSDGGINWQTNTRLTNNSYNSLEPDICVSGQTIHVIWDDTRFGNYEIMYKISTNGGDTWGIDTRLTLANGNSTNKLPQITTSGSALQLIWNDNRDGNREIYCKRNPTGNPSMFDSVYPHQNQFYIPLTSDILAYFHQSMNSSTFNSNNITFFGSMTGRKEGTFTYIPGNYSMQIVPNIPFKYGELINTILESGVKTSLGYSIFPFVWSFTTSSNPANAVFVQTSNTAVGTNPESIISADLDGDGDLDLAVPSNTSNSVAILKNDGSGILSQSSVVSVGANPMGLMSADLDGDGDIDLAVTNYNSHTVSVLINNGSGTFTQASVINVGIRPIKITSADFDGDGDMDLAVSNYYSHTVSILKNNGSGLFTQNSVITVGNYPAGIAAGDFDKDGDMDLSVTNQYANTVTILLNNSKGAFSISSSVNVGSQPFGMSAGDLDGDGNLDLAVTNYTSHNVSILINNGAGSFTQSSLLAVDSYPISITTSDLDGDGDPDLAINAWETGIVYIFKNSGNGTFSQSSGLQIGYSINEITSADFDGDGDMDLALTNYSSGSLSVIINLSPPRLVNPANDTTGILSSYDFTWNKSLGASNYRIQISTDSLFNNLTINDSTLLGTDSVKSISGLNSLTWYYWRMNSKSVNGLSLWSDTRKFKILGQPNHAILAEPVNNSVDQEFNITFKWYKTSEQTATVIKKQNTNIKYNINSKVQRKNDSRFFPDAVSKYWFEYGTDSTFANVIKRDSTLSDTLILVSGLNMRTKYYWRVKSKNEIGWGNFSPDWNFTTTYFIDSVLPVQNKINMPLTSDIKAYFHQNINSTTLDSNSITFFGSQSGKKRGSITYNSGNNSMQLVPNNPFKYGELISTTLDSGIKTIYGSSIKPFVWSINSASNPSNNIFINTSNVSSTANPFGLTTGDYDGDGDIDIAVANSGSNTISILLNNGKGIFLNYSSALTGNSPRIIAAGDIDNDGDLDIAVTNNSSTVVTILKNNGSGTFNLSSNVVVQNNPYGITSGDFQGDGYIDFAVTNWGSNSLSILINNGAGAFTVSSSIATGNNPYGITAGDFDNDGDIDIAESNWSGSVQILKNNGTANFTLTSTITTGGASPGINAVDLDGDGYLDLANSNYGSNSVQILKNNGSGTFSIVSSVNVNTPNGITTGDFNGDGYIDIAVSNYTYNTVSVLKNNGTGFFSLSPLITVGNNSIGIACGDFDNNGVLDLSSANYASNNISVVINLSPPRLLSPANNSNGTTCPVIFSWNKSLGAGNFKFQLATDSLFNNIIINDSTLLGTDTVKLVTELNPAPMYFWRMYSKSANGFSLWSETWRFDGTALPVELISFSASVEKNNVKLYWNTASEINNKGFDIERKIIGANDWEKITFIKGKGNSTSLTHYIFEDKKLNTGKYIYRLKQIDHNSNVEYFMLNQDVNIAPPEKFSLSQNYPNPFNPTTKIDFELPFDSKVKIAVYDLLGREVKILINSELKKAGYYSVDFSANNLASGIYIYRMTAYNQNKDFTLTKKMVIVK